MGIRRHMQGRVIALILPALLGACTAGVRQMSTRPVANNDACTTEANPLLHVPSPDWREQVIYFVLPDRFNDGDPANNDQGSGEFDPSSSSHYSGGDLRGLCRRLDYVHDLGATALWITPPVANQWWDGEHRFSGYHGYWASDFSRVDAHLGSLADYQALSSALHRRGMYLIQDVVLNHTGNFFHYDDAPPDDDPAQGYRRNRDSRPSAAPTQWPFSQNDPRDPAQRAAGVYHWTPGIRDFGDRQQELDFQLADLDDLDTGNPLVRDALFDSYAGWIRNAGVDAFRIDTAFYVPPGFLQNFAYGRDPAHPGMRAVAREVGADDFLLFGEGFGVEKPYADEVQRRIDGYLRDAAGRSVLPAMLDFPLYSALGDVFARGRPTAILAHRLRQLTRPGQDAGLQPRFVDNHDVERFLAGGSEAGLRQALLLLLTVPGIPVIYYGTEQGFRGQRDAMFAAGFGSGGTEHFDRDAPLYRLLQRLIALRRGDPLFTRGQPSALFGERSGPGALVYRLGLGDRQALIAFNSSDHPVLAGPLDAGLVPDATLTPRFRLDETSDESQAWIDDEGRLLLRLAPRAGVVWETSMARSGAAGTVSVRAPSLDPLPDSVHTPALSVEGVGEPGADLQLLLDGDLDRGVDVRVPASGRWQASIGLDGLVDPTLAHRLQLWWPSQRLASAARRFTVEPDWHRAAEAVDVSGDDHGPTGRYRYPLDAGWAGRHVADLRGVAVDAWNGSLRITIDLPELIRAWNPPNGFDHLALTVFLELPDRDGGTTVLPLQQGELPAAMRWHYRWRIGGWSVAGFSSDGADARHEGHPLSIAPLLSVDADHARIQLTIPATAIGRPATLDGARVWVNSWDHDGDYRELAAEPGNHRFGRGDGPAGAKWMDASPVLELSVPGR